MNVNSDELKGKWIFKKLQDSESMDPSKIQRAKDMFADLSFEFHDDMTYNTVIMGVSDNGRWKLISKEIEFSSSNSNTSTILWVEKIENGELFLRLKSGRVIILMKETKK